MNDINTQLLALSRGDKVRLNGVHYEVKKRVEAQNGSGFILRKEPGTLFLLSVFDDGSAPVIGQMDARAGMSPMPQRWLEVTSVFVPTLKVVQGGKSKKKTKPKSTKAGSNLVGRSVEALRQLLAPGQYLNINRLKRDFEVVSFDARSGWLLVDHACNDDFCLAVDLYDANQVTLLSEADEREVTSLRLRRAQKASARPAVRRRKEEAAEAKRRVKAQEQERQQAAAMAELTARVDEEVKTEQGQWLIKQATTEGRRIAKSGQPLEVIIEPKKRGADDSFYFLARLVHVDGPVVLSGRGNTVVAALRDLVEQVSAHVGRTAAPVVPLAAAGSDKPTVVTQAGVTYYRNLKDKDRKSFAGRISVGEHADVKPKTYVRLHGAAKRSGGLQPYDITFRVGDRAISDYGPSISFIRRIVVIGKMTVSMRSDTSGNKTRRISLYDFSANNRFFDLEEEKKKNREAQY